MSSTKVVEKINNYILNNFFPQKFYVYEITRKNKKMHGWVSTATTDTRTCHNVTLYTHCPYNTNL